MVNNVSKAIAGDGATDPASYNLTDLVNGEDAFGDSNNGCIEQGLIIQYEPNVGGQYGGGHRLSSINKYPVNPRGRTILATIEALRQAGFNTSSIRLLPQPCDSKDQELPIVNEDELRKSSELEYLAFALIRSEENYMSIAVGRYLGSIGSIETPGFTYIVRYKKIGSQRPPDLDQFLRIIADNAFPYDGQVDFKRIRPESLPLQRRADKILS